MLVADDSRPRWIEGFVREEDAMLVSVGQSARVRVPASRYRRIDAVVEQVGLHTLSLDRSPSGGDAGASSAARTEQVWVKLKPLGTLPNNPVTGTSARATIRVR